MADKRPILWRTALQAAFVVCYLYRGRCPRLLRVVPSRHRSACGFDFDHGFNGVDGFMSYLEAKHKPEKPLGDDGGRYP
ncbi:MAG: hypothetical protein PUE11_03025, partial [Paraprevotella sp.]|nr:hypothetical protein [Paraprevotella sp.]